MRRITALGLALVLLLGFALAGKYGATAQQGPPAKPTPAAHHPTPPVTRPKEEIQAIRDKIDADQAPYIQQFESKRRSVTGLKRAELPYNGNACFPSLADLVNGVPLIVIDTVKDVQFSAGGSGIKSVAGTHATVNVESYMKTSLASPPKVLTITQLGGPHLEPTGEEVLIQIAGDPILTPGDRHILFLFDNGNGIYRIAGDHGRYQLAGGKVHVLSQVMENPNTRDFAKAFAGMNQQEFFKEIQSLVPVGPSAR
ncbi:MAG: hypothetical protein ACR2PL_24860 [Dehalococcoidia bacterium]